MRQGLKMAAGILIRVVVAAVLSFAWFVINGEELTIAPPLTFFAMLYVTAAWFSYLKKDNLKLFPSLSRKKIISDEATEAGVALMQIREDDAGYMENGNKKEKEKEEEPEIVDRSEVMRGIATNLISAGVMFLLSFLALPPA